jgi:hypothetical protein
MNAPCLEVRPSQCHAFRGVLAHFTFVDDGALRPGVAFGALSDGADEFGVGLIDFAARMGTLHEERAKNQREGDDQGDKDKRNDMSASAGPGAQPIARE